MVDVRFHLRRADFVIRQRLAGQYVFIHINKCGGTSVEAALKIPVKLHDMARVRRMKIGRRRWEEAFTFALIRHPYERVASLHKFRIRTNQTGLGDRPIELNAWVRAAFAEKDPAYYDKPRMFAPCFDWVSDDSGKVIVEYIAKLETIGSQWPEIQQRIGTDAELPLRNVSAKGPGREALSAESRQTIQRHFAKDFEVFGYDT